MTGSAAATLRTLSPAAGAHGIAALTAALDTTKRQDQQNRALWVLAV
ncbi:hypothetical protein AB0K62_16985 [Streptomyces halstedii]